MVGTLDPMYKTLSFYNGRLGTDVETFNFQQHPIQHRLTTDVECHCPLMYKLHFVVVDQPMLFFAKKN